MLTHLFAPGPIGSIVIPNRLIVPAMVMNFCSDQGYPTDRYVEYHEAKARGGWGLIITEDYAIEPRGKGYTHIPGLWEDDQIEAHTGFTKRIHAYKSKIFAQIYHAGRQTDHLITGMTPVAPSPIPCPVKKEIPHELNILEIEELVEKFGDCALRVQRSGFDGLEIHGGHGYLIAQFLSSYSNKRVDKYGGSLFNRTRFAREVLLNVRKKVGKAFPISFRISADEFVPGGLTIEETKTIAVILEEAGVDVIHVSAGVYATRNAIVPPARVKRAWIADLAFQVKQIVNIPVITVGRINDPFIADQLIASRKTDFVAMGRASLADPELPNKVASEKYNDIIYCIGCMQGCSEKIRIQGQPAGCLLNPLTGRERELAIQPAIKKKSVLIAGCGIAGMQAAIVAAKRGHHVEVFEKKSKPGGLFGLAAVPPGKSDISSFIFWQKEQLDDLGVQFSFNQCLTSQTVFSKKPDVLIIATGSEPIKPNIVGIEQENVVSAIDVLDGSVVVGDVVFVLGGGMVGSETAHHLAILGRKVTIIEMTKEIAREEELSTKSILTEDLQKNNVEILLDSKVLEIQQDYLIIQEMDKKKKIGPVDTFVVAFGMKQVNSLEKDLKNKIEKIITIGDACNPRKAMEAIYEGYLAGLNC